jgi:NADH-quinone oxidoreductase subunit B
VPGGGGTPRRNRQFREEVMQVGLEEYLPAGFLLTTVEKWAGYARSRSMWPAFFGLACCAYEVIQADGPRHDLARFGMEKTGATPRQADLMIVAGRVSQKMAPVLRQIYDQMPDPKWVIAMGARASSGGMFNNYAIVQGADHIVPVDIYLPGCPPRPEMLGSRCERGCQHHKHARRSPSSVSLGSAAIPARHAGRSVGRGCGAAPAGHRAGWMR